MSWLWFVWLLVHGGEALVLWRTNRSPIPFLGALVMLAIVSANDRMPGVWRVAAPLADAALVELWLKPWFSWNWGSGTRMRRGEEIVASIRSQSPNPLIPIRCDFLFEYRYERDALASWKEAVRAELHAKRPYQDHVGRWLLEVAWEGPTEWPDFDQAISKTTAIGLCHGGVFSEGGVTWEPIEPRSIIDL